MVQQTSQKRLPTQEQRAGELEAGCDRVFAGLASSSWRGHEIAEKVAHPEIAEKVAHPVE